MIRAPRRYAFALFTALAMLAVVLAAPAAAILDAQTRLTAPPDTSLHGRVATDGDTLVAAASLVGPPGFGVVHAFVRDGDTWRHQDQLTPDDPVAWQEFGSALAVDGNLIVVGARFDDEAVNEGGAVYVFTRSGETWTQQAKLTAEGDAVETELFGSAVAISGSMILVGAPHETDFPNRGSVYVFERSGSNWVRHSQLFGTVQYDHFGQSLDVDGATLLVGAPWEFSSADLAGAAYVHVWNGVGWARQARLVAPDGAEWDRMGGGVALDGDTAVAGAVFHNVIHSDEGAAYVFTRSGTTWSFEQKLTAPDANTGDRFGSVGLQGDVAVIGAYLAGDAGRHSGTAYLFTRSAGTWSFDRKLLPSEHGPHDGYGSDVDLLGGTAVVGARGSGPGGAVFVHETGVGLFCDGLAATIVGTNGDDVINGTAGADVIVALRGADIVRSGGGDDTVCGGHGDDIIDGGFGNDRLEGGPGNDDIVGRWDDDMLVGGPGSDLLDGSMGVDDLRGGPGGDELWGGADPDLLVGGLGNDTLHGGDGPDVLKGGAGNDRLLAGPGDDRALGGDDDDELSGGPGTDHLDGGPGTDSCSYGETLVDCE